MQYFNIINNSDLRDNELYNLNSSLEWNTSFGFPINLSNELIYNYTESRFDNDATQFRTLNYNTKLILKLKKSFTSSLTSNYFDPNLGNQSDRIHFMDFNFRYTSPTGDWNINLTANNILNTSFYNRVELTDFTQSSFQNQLLGRVIMLSTEFSF